jgi:hypothetical protein
MFATASKLVRELREATKPCPTEGRVRGAQHVEAKGPPNPHTPPGAGPTAWAHFLADSGERLIADGFEQQATYLMAASGQLLVAAERAELP